MLKFYIKFDSFSFARGAYIRSCLEFRNSILVSFYLNIILKTLDQTWPPTHSHLATRSFDFVVLETFRMLFVYDALTHTHSLCEADDYKRVITCTFQFEKNYARNFFTSVEKLDSRGGDAVLHRCIYLFYFMNINDD